MSGFDKLQKEVIGAGLCMFCGSCVGVCPSKVLEVNYDVEEPRATKVCPPRCELCYEVCPGKDIPMPDLDKVTFGRQRNADEEFTGINQAFVEAHAVDPLIRIGGAAGGLVTALLLYALENNIIDAAIVCGQTTKQPWRAVAKIATTRQEILDSAQTKSGVSPNNSLLSEAIEKGYKRLGVVGVPCQIEAIRKMQLLGRPKKLINSIKFTIGLFCGSNWNHKGIEHIMEEICRVPLDEIAKWKRRDGAYPGLWTVYTRDGRRIVIPDSGRRTYAMGFIKERCTVCRDYSAELADIAAGDYLAPHMVPGAPGETATVIRTDIGRRLMEGAEAANYVGAKPADKVYILWGGWELKKHGNVYRILERRKFGRATPDFHWPLDYPSPMPRKTILHPHL